MTKKTAAPPAPDAELVENIATVKRGVEAKVAAIKRGLAQWIDQNIAPAHPAEIALLELALDRYLAIYGDPDDAYDTIQADLHHALRKSRIALQ